MLTLDGAEGTMCVRLSAEWGTELTEVFRASSEDQSEALSADIRWRRGTTTSTRPVEVPDG
ncbi:hypothetical protein CJ179_33670 [Rhodococcus sp. ACS1]|jgi:hypothetical protein|uniref:hypothetical protein n=1 Tax=Rhodococcus TaxID=1827 RepID=UPI00093266C8|nr:MULTISPECIES: hypothetical protein [Rhodococcus]PBC40045.1 hypothetical protein CJ179_33670 [Rhodococcus sp. ACS1]